MRGELEELGTVYFVFHQPIRSTIIYFRRICRFAQHHYAAEGWGNRWGAVVGMAAVIASVSALLIARILWALVDGAQPAIEP